MLLVWLQSREPVFVWLLSGQPPRPSPPPATALVCHPCSAPDDVDVLPYRSCVQDSSHREASGDSRARVPSPGRHLLFPCPSPHLHASCQLSSLSSRGLALPSGWPKDPHTEHPCHPGADSPVPPSTTHAVHRGGRLSQGHVGARGLPPVSGLEVVRGQPCARELARTPLSSRAGSGALALLWLERT